MEPELKDSSSPIVSALAWGAPLSPGTYSGLPSAVFGQFKRRNRLHSCYSLRPDLLTSLGAGRLSLRRWLGGRSLGDPLWRYSPQGRRCVSERLKALSFPEVGHGVIMQFGTSGSPPSGAPLVAHIEYPIDQVFGNKQFATSYGMLPRNDQVARQAIAGEREFMHDCDLIWTNTQYTKRLFPEPIRDRVRVLTPGAKLTFPRKEWSHPDAPEILFIGRNWENKGGPLVLEAFRILRKQGIPVRLTVIGCTPEVSEKDVEILGLLRMDVPAERAQFAARLQSARVFCMPSYWETTGMVYWEAACAGLPVVMQRIPPTDEIFPDALFDKVDGENVEWLAQILGAYCVDRELAESKGRQLAEFSEARFGPSAFFAGVEQIVEEAWLLGEGRRN